MGELVPVTSKTKIYCWISLTLFLLGLLSWIPYVVFNVQEPFGMLTFILNPVGIFIGYYVKNRFLAFSNLAMTFSFIPVVIYIYLSKGYIPM
ncbi:hypothetical protein ABID96_001102 [Bacillus sp. OAE603]